MIDRLGLVYVKTKTKLSDLSNGVQSITIIRYDNGMINCIDMVYDKKKRSNYDWLDRVLFVTKTRSDNDMIGDTNVVYAKHDIELSWPIRLGVVCDEN